MTDDAQAKLEFENAYELYRQRPDENTGRQLQRALCAYVIPHRRDIAVYGPCLAITLTLLERKHWRGGKFISRAFIWFLERGLGKPLPPKRPGWNDYYMVRWQLTREQRWADEIHRRTHYTDENMVGWTANWMAQSQRQQDVEFDHALCIAEVECGCHAQSAVTHTNVR